MYRPINTPITQPYWPRVSLEDEAAFGRMVIAWGVLEVQLDELIAQLMQIDIMRSSAVSANLPAQQKLNAIQSLAQTQLLQRFAGDKAIADLVKRIGKLSGGTSGLATEWRNTLAHGQPIPVSKTTYDEAGSEPLGPDDVFHLWSHLTAGKAGIRGRVFRLDSDAVAKAVEEVREVVTGWHAIRLEVDGILKAATPAAGG